MKIAIYLKKSSLEADPRFMRLVEGFRNAGCEVYRVHDDERMSDYTDMLVAVGGDGTFLSSAVLAGPYGVPVFGVNFGRLGFLSESKPETAVGDIMSGNYSIEERTMLGVAAEDSSGCFSGFFPYALNEMTVHRSGPAMLGVDVTIDGSPLPAYWADGLLVATSSGSTAYSLSVGGPIVLPESRVLIISPIAPHNLNVRPLIVPDTAEVRISLRSRDEKVLFTADNRSMEIDPDVKLVLSMARFSLKRVRLNGSNFINALTSKLFWGEDIRNGSDR